MTCDSLRQPSFTALTLACVLAPLAGHAQAQGATVDERLQALERRQAELEQAVKERDAIIEELRGKPLPPQSPPAQAATTIAGPVETSNSPLMLSPPSSDTATEPADGLGRYKFGTGLVLARGELGELDFGLTTYFRYLNQRSLEPTYTDSFGRTFTLDRREDAQFNKVTLNFKGWMFDERFRYLVFVWTANTSQGQGAQVVIAGNLSYTFNENFTLAGGIGALPTTRTTMYTYPNWLRVDNRTIADDYFRGSYTSGFWGQGKIVDDLYYRVMVGNNLSQLGVDAGQLAAGMNTFSGAVWWMPTTGEYGPATGYGDFEQHQQVATLFGASYTQSREDAESQPGVNDFENAQLRLSDGTRIFQPNSFNTGARINEATYKMFSLNAGLKYRGWSVDAEYYLRRIDDFDVTGTIPVDELNDSGFQLQASMFAIPEALQLYVSGSKIFGEYGDPYDVALGANWFPLNRREVRANVQALYLDRSPVGYNSVPLLVGGTGWVFTTDVVLAF